MLFELSPNGTTGKQASVSRLGEWPLKLKESKIQNFRGTELSMGMKDGKEEWP